MGIAREHRWPATTKPGETHTIIGLLSATEDRAIGAAHHRLESELTDWLEGVGIPRSWKPPTHEVDRMILETKVQPIVKDYGTLYEAKLRVDVSPEQRASFVKTHHLQVVHWRMAMLGGLLAFVLTCLAAISSYIRADEVTKGYYTNRLRVLTLTAVGAAGGLIYHLVS
jgi:hypothetical protein